MRMISDAAISAHSDARGLELPMVSRVICFADNGAMHTHSSIVYVIRSEKDPTRYYTGLTDNVERRVAVHNSGGSLYTAALRPWRLVAFTELRIRRARQHSSSI
jgi:predicted GIY-YIG superfamily endonuclease